MYIVDLDGLGLKHLWKPGRPIARNYIAICIASVTSTSTRFCMRSAVHGTVRRLSNLNRLCVVQLQYRIDLNGDSSSVLAVN